MRRGVRLFLMAAVLVLTVACDQATKAAARRALGSGTEHTLLGGVLTLTLAENQGSFLSLGATFPAVLRMAVVASGVITLLAVTVVLLRNRGASSPLLVAVTLMLAGATGNLVDRLARGGRVTDFLLLGAGSLHTGIFNVADVAIMAGAAAVVVAGLRRQPSRSHDPRRSGPPPPCAPDDGRAEGVQRREVPTPRPGAAARLEPASPRGPASPSRCPRRSTPSGPPGS